MKFALLQGYINFGWPKPACFPVKNIFYKCSCKVWDGYKSFPTFHIHKV